MERLLFVAFATGLLVGCGNYDNDVRKPVLVQLPASALKEYSDTLHAASFNLDHKRSQQTVQGYLSPVALANLPERLHSQIEEITDEGQTSPLEGYHDYEALTAELENITRTYGNIATLKTAGQSVDGRELWYVKISDKPTADEAEPKFLYIANMHGNETAGRELMIYLIRNITEKYATDASVKNLVDHAQIYIMPSMNPDGFEAGQRGNANYVDLNRDFPDFSSDPDMNFSSRQPETQAIMTLHEQNHFALAINYHGGAVCFNLPWDTTPNRTRTERFGDDAVISTYGAAYARSNPTMYASSEFRDGLTYGYEWYEVDGGMQDFANYYHQSIHATVELSNTKYPDASRLQGIWDENTTSIMDFLKSGLTGVHIKVTNDEDQTLQNVKIELESSTRPLSYKSGQLSRLSLTGTQKVKVSAPGFKSKELQLDATTFDGSFTPVQLEAAK